MLLICFYDILSNIMYSICQHLFIFGDIFKCCQKFLAKFLLSDRKKNVTKDHMCSSVAFSLSLVFVTHIYDSVEYATNLFLDVHYIEVVFQNIIFPM